ncbi:MAG TPA: hypothetical protein VGK17_09195 [Propionicimonas sp.]|jgi:hypothetical protein
MTITPPPRTRSLQGPGRDNEPDPFASLAKQLADLRQRIDDATAQVLRMAGLRAEPNLLRALGSLVVEGDLAVPSGKITLAGVDRDLDTALNNLAAAQSNITALIGQQVTGWTGEATQDVATYPNNGNTGVYSTVNVPVPAGYSTAYVTAVSSARAQALIGKDIAIRLKSIINGNESREFSDGGPLGASVSTGHSVTVTGLSGGTIAVSTRVGVTNVIDTTSGWTATSVTVVFVR